MRTAPSSSPTPRRGLALVSVPIASLLLLAGGATAHPHPDEHGFIETPHEGNANYTPESENTTVVGHVDPGTGFNADVWAHGDHAFLASWGTFTEVGAFCPALGVRAIDLSDPADPEIVGTFADGSDPELADSWTEKVVVQRVRGRDLAAVSFQACAPDGFRGFGVYDVTDPSDPTELSRVELIADHHRGSHEIWLEKRGNRAYVYTAVINKELHTSPDGETPGSPDFQIFDVSDPTSPQKVGEWGAWSELGIKPDEPDDVGARSRFVHSVIGSVAGRPDRAYLSYWDLGTVILDVSDPSDPQLLGIAEVDEQDQGSAHSAWLARGGNILIETDEVFDPHPDREQAWGYPTFYDIRDPSDPTELGTFEMPSTRQVDPAPGPGFWTVHDPKVRGNTAYLSWYAEGVVVLDISDPASPTKLAQFVPEPAADPNGVFFPGEEFANVWGTDLHRGTVLASDINSGLWIFEVDR